MLRLLEALSKKCCKEVERVGEKMLWTEWFNVSCSSDDLGLQWASEDYEMTARQEMSFTPCHAEAKAYEPETAMLKVIGEIMQSGDEDCVLLANGCAPIVLRRNGKTIVDDHRWVDREHFPYEALGIDFEWGVIPYD